MSSILEGMFYDDEPLDENLRKWFKEKWVRFGPDGKIKGPCARGSDSEGKPKCLPQKKAHSLGKKGRKYAAAKKRREDPNPERRGKAKNVATKKKTNEQQLDEKCWDTHKQVGMKKKGDKMVPNCVPKESVKEDQAPMFTPESKCPHCGGKMVSEELMNEKKDACYYKVKSRYKVWPSAYASGALVQCRKKGASNWGTKSESSIMKGLVKEDKNMYPLTYTKFHKDPNDPTKVKYVEVLHANIDLAEKPTTPERVRYLVQNSDTHNNLKAKGYKLDAYGEHKTPTTFYTYPVKITKQEEIEEGGLFKSDDRPKPILGYNEIRRWAAKSTENKKLYDAWKKMEAAKKQAKSGDLITGYAAQEHRLYREIIKQVKKDNEFKDFSIDEGMPSSVIKHKTILNSMSPEELFARFDKLSKDTGISIQDVAKATAWRHGYGKESPHYWNKIKDLVVSETNNVGEKPMSALDPKWPLSPVEKRFRNNPFNKKDLKENASTEDLYAAWQEAQKITRAIKYDRTPSEIIVKIQLLAEKYGIKSPELELAIDEVYAADNALESAVYELDNVIGQLYDSAKNAEEDRDLDEGAISEAGRVLIKSLDGVEKAFSNPHAEPAKNWAHSYAHKKNDPAFKKFKPKIVKPKKPTTDEIMMAIMTKISEFPETEPYEVLKSYMHKNNLEWEDLNKAAKKNGYDGVWGYWEELHKEAGTGLARESDMSEGQIYSTGGGYGQASRKYKVKPAGTRESSIMKGIQRESK